MYHAYMSDEVVYELASSLITLATARGFAVNRLQLRNWYHAGLLPQWGPARKTLHHSNGKGKDTDARYPSGTGTQMLALCEVHRTERRLAKNGWQLWWRGYSVNPSFARDPIEHALKELEDFLVFVRRNGGSSDTLIAQLTARPSMPLMGKIKRRVGGVASRRVVHVLIQVLEGTFTGWHSEDRYVLEQGLRLDEARELPFPLLQVLVPKSLTGTVREMSQRFNIRRLREALNAATDDDLAVARDEIRATLIAIDAVLLMFASWLGKGEFLRVLLPSSATVEEEGQPLFLLLWLALRRVPVFAEGYPKLMEALGQVSAINRLIRELPPDMDKRQIERGMRKQLRAAE